jgi:hypothetical protein
VYTLVGALDLRSCWVLSHAACDFTLTLRVLFCSISVQVRDGKIEKSLRQYRPSTFILISTLYSPSFNTHFSTTTTSRAPIIMADERGPTPSTASRSRASSIALYTPDQDTPACLQTPMATTPPLSTALPETVDLGLDSTQISTNTQLEMKGMESFKPYQ